MSLVSVWMTTYNHQEFIEEAIQSVLNQKTEFDFEIVIGEDFSTDNTRNIVKDLREKFPEKIKLFLPDRNLGMLEMVRATYPLCKGKYVASLDGDDYWTDQYKLQKQVDFMESNPDFVLHCHRAKVINEIRGFEAVSDDSFLRNPDNSLELKHFLRAQNPIVTSSILYRNVLGDVLPEWYYHLAFPDYSWYFLLLKHGKIKYSPEIMVVYRVHKGGIWSGNELYKNYSDMIDYYDQLLLKLPYIKGKHINRSKAHYHYLCLLSDIKKKNKSGIKKHFTKISRLDPYLMVKHFKTLVSISLRTLTSKSNQKTLAKFL